MKRTNVLLILIMISQMLSVADERFIISDILSDELLTYCAKVDILISMPVLQHDVNFSGKIISLPEADNTQHLCACEYLIEIEDSLRVKSVYSYFDGKYFAFSGGKLRTYSWEQDSLQFMDREVNGRNINGIHKSGVFPLLVPGIMKEQLDKLVENKNTQVFSKQDTLPTGQSVMEVRTVEYMAGVSVKEMKLVVDSKTHSPLYYRIVTNLGTLSEQVVIALFEKCSDVPETINEQFLKVNYPGIFH